MAGARLGTTPAERSSSSLACRGEPEQEEKEKEEEEGATL